MILQPGGEIFGRDRGTEKKTLHGITSNGTEKFELLGCGHSVCGYLKPQLMGQPRNRRHDCAVASASRNVFDESTVDFDAGDGELPQID